MSLRATAIVTTAASAIVAFAVVRVALGRTDARQERNNAGTPRMDRPAPFVYSPRRAAAAAAVARSSSPTALTKDLSRERGLIELHADVRAQDGEIGTRWPKVLNDLVTRMFDAVGGTGGAPAPCFPGDEAGSGAPLFFQVEIAIDSDRDALRTSQARVLDDALTDPQRRCVERTLDALAPVDAAEAGGPLPDLRIAIVVPFVVHRTPAAP